MKFKTEVEALEVRGGGGLMRRRRERVM